MRVCSAVPSTAAKKLIGSRMQQVPAKRNAAQLWIHQHRAVAIIPGKAQQARLSGPIIFRGFEQLLQRFCPRASRWR